MSYNNNSHIYEKLSFLDFILSFQKFFSVMKKFFLYSNQFINKLISILKIPILKLIYSMKNIYHIMSHYNTEN